MNDYYEFKKNLKKYEKKYHKQWCQESTAVIALLQNSLLSMNQTTHEISVNMDKKIYELIRECRKMRMFKLHVPEAIVYLLNEEQKLWKYQMKLNELTVRCKKVRESIPQSLRSLLKPYNQKIFHEFMPGVSEISWTSLNIDKCIY